MTPEDLMFEALPLPAIIHDESTIIDANEAASEILEADSVDAVVGLALHDIIHSDARDAGQARRPILWEGHRFYGIPTKVVSRKGNTIPASVAAVPFRIGNRLLTIVVSGDVDYPVYRECEPSAIAEYSEDTPTRAAALDALPLPLLLNVRGTTIKYANKATARLLKAGETSELIGRSTVDIAHPDMRELILERIRLQVVGAAPHEVQPVKLQAFDGSDMRVRLRGHFVERHGETFGVWAITGVES